MPATVMVACACNKEYTVTLIIMAMGVYLQHLRTTYRHTAMYISLVQLSPFLGEHNNLPQYDIVNNKTVCLSIHMTLDQWKVLRCANRS